MNHHQLMRQVILQIKKCVNNESSYNETTISVGNQKILSDSINTSDINIITVDNKQINKNKFNFI